MTTDQSSAGWYADPADEADLRWWDGQQWTTQVHVILTADEIAGDAPTLEQSCDDDWYEYRSPNDRNGEPVMIRMRRRTLFDESWLEFTRHDGVVLGAIGIESGLIETENREMRLHLRWGLFQWCQRRSIAVPLAGDCVDLALNRPGHGLLEIEARERAKAPKRSWIRRLLRPTPRSPWLVGADGETAVGDTLASLGRGWFYLHSVPVGGRGADIDHVAIGPAGVFTINTKNHPSKAVVVTDQFLNVGRFATDYAEKSRFEGERAQRLVSRSCGRTIPVRPLIVVSSPKLHRTGNPSGITVLRSDELASWLQAQPQLLSQEESVDVFHRVRWAETWA